LGDQFALGAPDDDAVVEWTECHEISFWGRRIGRPHHPYTDIGTRKIGVPEIIRAKRKIIETAKILRESEESEGMAMNSRK
ncbi:hypothetical protein, partial [Aquibium carbonis]|uniref:hypothetical protein n=1 Tax=Aquibium carbonis TaxID=2495581 RepID=UPI001AECE399